MVEYCQPDMTKKGDDTAIREGASRVFVSGRHIKKKELIIMSIEILAAVVSAVVALTAVIVPLITVVINNKHQLELQKISFISQTRLEIYQEFLDYMPLTFSLNAFADKDICVKLRQILSKVYLVCSDDTRKLLDILNNIIAEGTADVGADKRYWQAYIALNRSMRNDLKELR